MATFILKRFSERESYRSIKQRIKDTSISALFGAAIGVIPGIILGSIFGSRGTKYGAMIGAGLGAYGLGKMDWKHGSNEEVDKRNKILEEKEKREAKYINNPKTFLNPLLNKKDSDYKDIGLPKEFFKLLQINRQFIPIAEKLIKEHKTLWSPRYIIPEAKVLKSWREDSDDEGGVIILIDPNHSDDTFILWYPEDNTYSTDSYDYEREDSLKDILVQCLSDDIEFSLENDDHLLRHGIELPRIEIDKAYLDFIKKRL